MKIHEILPHGIIEATGEKTYKFRLIMDHHVCKKLRSMNDYGNCWQLKTYQSCIDMYEKILKLTETNF